MFDIGFWEILIIGVVALVVVGPERLPAVATFAGHWVGRFRRFANHMRNEIQEELETEHLKSMLEEQNRELKSLRREVDGVRDDAEKVMQDTRTEVDRTGAASPGEPETAAATDGPAREEGATAAPEGSSAATGNTAPSGRSAAKKKTEIGRAHV